MRKEIEVCDICEKEKVLSSKIAHRLCTECLANYDLAYSDAIKEVQKRVDFYVHERLYILSVLEHPECARVFGSASREMRERLIEEIKNER